MNKSHAWVAFTVWLWTCLCFSFNISCAASKSVGAPGSATPTVAITCSSVKALGNTFLATATLIDTAFDAKLITPQNYLPWRDFSLRFQAAYAIADKTCEQAVANNDQSVIGVINAEMSLYEQQLPTFAALAHQVMHPDGGSL